MCSDDVGAHLTGVHTQQDFTGVFLSRTWDADGVDLTAGSVQQRPMLTHLIPAGRYTVATAGAGAAAAFAAPLSAVCRRSRMVRQQQQVATGVQSRQCMQQGRSLGRVNRFCGLLGASGWL